MLVVSVKSEVFSQYQRTECRYDGRNEDSCWCTKISNWTSCWFEQAPSYKLKSLFQDYSIETRLPLEICVLLGYYIARSVAQCNAPEERRSHLSSGGSMKLHDPIVHLLFMDPCIVDDSVEIPTRCRFVIEFIIPKFFEGSTCFERHTAHHQEL